MMLPGAGRPGGDMIARPMPRKKVVSSPPGQGNLPPGKVSMKPKPKMRVSSPPGRGNLPPGGPAGRAIGPPMRPPVARPMPRVMTPPGPGNLPPMRPQPRPISPPGRPNMPPRPMPGQPQDFTSIGIPPPMGAGGAGSPDMQMMAIQKAKQAAQQGAPMGGPPGMPPPNMPPALGPPPQMESVMPQNNGAFEMPGQQMGQDFAPEMMENPGMQFGLGGGQRRRPSFGGGEMM